MKFSLKPNFFYFCEVVRKFISCGTYKGNEFSLYIHSPKGKNYTMAFLKNEAKDNYLLTGFSIVGTPDETDNKYDRLPAEIDVIVEDLQHQAEKGSQKAQFRTIYKA